MNVDIPPITIGGAVSVGANGFSRNYGPYSDFILKLRLSIANGNIKRNFSNSLFEQLFEFKSAFKIASVAKGWNKLPPN